MKSILTSLIVTLAAANAFAAPTVIEKAQKSPDSQAAPPVQAQVAEENVDLAALFDKMNRAAKENDFDAMRAIVDESIQNDKLSNDFKAELAETLCSAEINELGRKGDLEGLKKYYADLLEKATSSPAYAGCAKLCAELVAIYAPKLEADPQKTINEQSNNAKNVQVQSFFGYNEPTFKGAAPYFDETLFNVEPGHDRAYYRKQLADLVEAGRIYQTQTINARVEGNLSSVEFQQRARGAQLKLLREIVLSEGSENDREFNSEFDRFYATLALWEPESRDPYNTTEGLDAEFIIKTIADLRAKKIQEPFLEKQVASRIDNLERGLHNKTARSRLNKALNGSEAERREFLTFFKDELRAFPQSASETASRVVAALNANQPDLATEIVRVVEDFQKETPDDVSIQSALAEAKRALNRPPLENLVGKTLELSGVDVNFNEASLDAYRGKYVVVYFAPREITPPYYPENDARALAEFVEKADSEKVSVLEYDETALTTPMFASSNLRADDVQKSLDLLRARPWTVVSQALSIRANAAFDAHYPALFRDYRFRSPRFALVDPDGVVLAVEPTLWNVQRRLELVQNEKANQ